MHLGVGDDGFKHLDRFIRGVRNAKAMKSVNRIKLILYYLIHKYIEIIIKIYQEIEPNPST